MRIVIWGCGRMSYLVSDYIRHDVEIAAYVDSNPKYWGGGYLALWA